MARTWGRRLAKIGGYGILVLLLVAAIALTFTVGWRPVIGAKKRPLTTRKFATTPERLRRGEYLVHAIIDCMGCHSEYDRKTDPPVLLSREGAGSVLFEDESIRLVGPILLPIRKPASGSGAMTASDGPSARASPMTEGR
ncbi:MAG: hypothetical protein ABSH32_18495 [Bryobacteraceae bacterium]|jgi:hypothetical protein